MKIEHKGDKGKQITLMYYSILSIFVSYNLVDLIHVQFLQRIMHIWQLFERGSIWSQTCSRRMAPQVVAPRQQEQVGCVVGWSHCQHWKKMWRESCFIVRLWLGLLDNHGLQCLHDIKCTLVAPKHSSNVSHSSRSMIL